MQLSETRFVKIEGTAVSAAVTTADEAKLALKELRHKKKEVAHRKRALLRQKKAADALTSRSKRRTARTPKRQGLLAKTRSAIEFLAGLPAVFQRVGAQMDGPKLEREIVETDDIAHNLDTVILKIEGQLLHFS